MFKGVPTFDISEEPVLYYPVHFNNRAIDGIIIRFGLSEKENGKKGTCFMFPLQITVAKSHKNSEKEFFKNWHAWTKDLMHFDIEVEFLWITDKESGEGTHKRLRRNRAMPGDGVSAQQGNARGIKRDGVPKKGQGPKTGRSRRNKQAESDERSKTVVKTAAQPHL